jgi:hypothetical protein
MHPRSQWTLEQYIEEMERVYNYEPVLDPQQWKQILALLENEIKDRFPAEIRSERGLRF